MEEVTRSFQIRNGELIPELLRGYGIKKFNFLKQ